jgi:hypothetical protein
MSLDHIYYVAAGMRNDSARKFTACRDDEARKILNERGGTPHQVRFDHGDCGDVYAVIDEQYFFEDAEDARWFYREGYKRMLYEGEESPDRMSLFIDGQETQGENQ